jgi:hypothetical protein
MRSKFFPIQIVTKFVSKFVHPVLTAFISFLGIMLLVLNTGLAHAVEIFVTVNASILQLPDSKVANTVIRDLKITSKALWQ